MTDDRLLTDEELMAAYEAGNPTDDHAIGCQSLARLVREQTLKEVGHWVQDRILHNYEVVRVQGSAIRIIHPADMADLITSLTSGQMPEEKK